MKMAFHLHKAALNRIEAKLDRVLALLGDRAPASVRFGIARFTTKGGQSVSGSLNFADDDVATVPLVFKDQNGVVHAPPTGGTAASDNSAVATAALSADGGSVVITPVADGSCNVSYSNGALSDSISVTVSPPAPTSVALDAADATFAAKS
ncbi:MAG TPA: hypothetical protein VM755_19825 [Stellaceae bacterium]|nr:hypothetical protein [Stellaceae bacterium]